MLSARCENNGFNRLRLVLNRCLKISSQIYQLRRADVRGWILISSPENRKFAKNRRQAHGKHFFIKPLFGEIWWLTGEGFSPACDMWNSDIAKKTAAAYRIICIGWCNPKAGKYWKISEERTRTHPTPKLLQKSVPNLVHSAGKGRKVISVRKTIRWLFNFRHRTKHIPCKIFH